MSNRRPGSRLAAFCSLLLAFALLAAACGGNDDDTSASPKDTKASGKDSSQAGFNEAQFAGTPSEGGAISFGMESNIASLDPGEVAQPSDVVTALAIYDQLIQYDDKGNLAPGLATKWETSEDLKTWTITTREGVKFQDGTPFNSEAVKAQFERFLDPKTNCTCLPNVAQIAKIDTPDANTVVFTLKDPNAFWANTLAGGLGLIASPTATAKYGPDYARHPVGTGPFALPDYENLVLKKNPSYWRKDDKGVQLPYLDQITMKAIPDARIRLQSLESGDVDMIQTADTGSLVDAISQGDKYGVQKVTGTSSTIIVFNMKGKPFDDLRMRQAVAYGLNRAQLNSVQYKGTRQEAYLPFPPSSPFFADIDVPKYDQAKAKKLVAEAKADGVSTDFTALCIPTDESRRLLGLVQQQMKAIGLNMTNEFQDQGAFVNRMFAKTGDYQAACFRSPQIANADGLYGSLHTDQPTNIMFYSNATADKALESIRQTTDAKEQAAALKVVQTQIAKDVPSLPLLYDLFGNVYTNSISGLPVPEPWSLGAIETATLYLKK